MKTEKATQETSSRKEASIIIDAYSTRCAKCKKWRFLNSEEEYEEIISRSPNKSFSCKNCEEPEVDVKYHWTTVCLLGGSRPIVMQRERNPSSDVVSSSHNANGDATSSKKKRKRDGKEGIRESKKVAEVVFFEELDKGNLDGEVAAKGKKVSIFYTAKLKDTGKLFETNLGEAPVKFRIGREKVIKGLEIGVEGMRVGGKRRITIPPSLGYSEEGFKDVVPKNAWLVYEVEAVKIR
ncbi:peptidyl-prolyl cis-trans isomerase FKBP43 [Eutrema salsugineum]|uniref:peptidyl-prolyl cis-trans isomerase FKBP43 n=1 Tax=Eutrema salsugineum TaxID=72664 RepID=UPI000CECE5F5|nr:peptidyl-prolyl cis-trans isomerase FKBP43 [Eutrema salsugineum]